MMPMQCARKTARENMSWPLCHVLSGTRHIAAVAAVRILCALRVGGRSMSTVMIDLSRRRLHHRSRGDRSGRPVHPQVPKGARVGLGRRHGRWGTFLFFLQESYPPDLGPHACGGQSCSGTGLAVGWRHVDARLHAHGRARGVLLWLCLACALGNPRRPHGARSQTHRPARKHVPARRRVHDAPPLREDPRIPDRTYPYPSQAIPEPEDDAYRDEPRSSARAPASWAWRYRASSSECRAGFRSARPSTSERAAGNPVRHAHRAVGPHHMARAKPEASDTACQRSGGPILARACAQHPSTCHIQRSRNSDRRHHHRRRQPLSRRVHVGVGDRFRPAPQRVGLLRLGGRVVFALVISRSFGRLLVLRFAQGETTGSTVLIALLLFMLIGSTALGAIERHT